MEGLWRLKSVSEQSGKHEIGKLLWGPKSAHTFLLFGNELPIYTGHRLHRAFWQEFFCVLRRLHEALSVKAQLHT